VTEGLLAARDVTRAAVVTGFGAVPVLETITLPQRSAGTTLIDVIVAPLNPLDLAIASGAFHSVRHEVAYVPGSECIGRVVESATWPVGSWIYAECHASPTSPGPLAVRARVRDETSTVVPAGLNPVLAAALGNAGVAAYLPLVDIAALRPGETVLVLGATGAVGQLAVQIARRRGAGRIVGVGRDVDALERVLALGADAVVELRDDESVAELTSRLRHAVGEVDVVLDGVFGQPFEASLGVCAPGARIVNIGNGAGTVAALPAGLLRGRRLTLTGFAGLHTPFDDKRTALAWLWAAIADGDLAIDVRTFDLDQVTEAWRVQATSPHGKCAVLPTRDTTPETTS